MCLIITRKYNGQVDWQSADRSARHNPDGYGVGYAENGKAVMFRNLAWAPVRAKAKELEARNEQFVLHMRMATHGAVNLSNCHPLPLPEHNLVMAHNGIIWKLNIPQGVSDSRVLADHLNDNFQKGFHVTEKGINTMTELCEGFPSKLSFIDGMGDVFFINEDCGAWQDNVWYSVPSAISTFNRKHFNPLAMTEERDTLSTDVESTYDAELFNRNYWARRAKKMGGKK